MSKQKRGNKFYQTLISIEESQHPLGSQNFIEDKSKQSLLNLINKSNQIITHNQHVLYQDLLAQYSEQQSPQNIKSHKIVSKRIPREQTNLRSSLSYANKPEQIREEEVSIFKKEETPKKNKHNTNPAILNQSPHFSVYHNNGFQHLVQTSQFSKKMKNNNHPVEITKRLNKQLAFARVHSLQRQTNFALTKKNQTKINFLQNQLNKLWMGALNGTDQQDNLQYLKSGQRFHKDPKTKLQNINHNIRYVRKLKPLGNMVTKKQGIERINQCKMKVSGRGQSKSEKPNKNLCDKSAEKINQLHSEEQVSQIQETEKTLEIERQDETLVIHQKNLYSEVNETKLKQRIKKNKEIKQLKNTKVQDLTYQEPQNRKKQDKLKTLNHSNSQFSPNYRLAYKKSLQSENKYKNSYMLEENPQTPIILIPTSTIIFPRSQKKRTSNNPQLIYQKTENLNQQQKTKKLIKPKRIKDIKSKVNIPVIPKNTRKQFNPVLSTYYYRDLLWKVNYSNQIFIYTPLQYEHRLRVFIGKGNNSGLIRGLIKRRIWFAITDRIEDANYVWTQLKNLSYFQLQKTYIQEQRCLQSSLNQYTYRQNGLMTSQQTQRYKKYFEINWNIQQRQDERLIHRWKVFTNPNKSKFGVQNLSNTSNLDLNNQRSSSFQENNQLIKNNSIPIINNTILKTVGQIKQQKMQNHFINNYIIGNKKTLFKTMSAYYKNNDDYVFNYLPYTFHIAENSQEDQGYAKFLRFYQQRQKQIDRTGKDGQLNTKNYWIVKPGENSNRGYGIKLCKNLQEINQIVDKHQQKYQDGTFRTFILQTYIDKPLLYQKRKFDIRHYMMITCVNGILKGYWYRDGYVRTTSTQYTLQTSQTKVHLTNDAVQKYLPEYGKYQKGNKISYEELNSYLNRNYGYKNYQFNEIILPKMKKITTDIIKACSGSIDPELRGNNFEIYGLDFMIDQDFNLWLIEVNTNPCLEISCPLLGSIIPKMIENALELTLDTTFPPPVRYNPKGVHYLKKLEDENRFDLVYDSRVDGLHRSGNDVLDINLLQEEDETFEDDGEQWSGQD